jgi:predicted deacylase
MSSTVESVSVTAGQHRISRVEGAFDGPTLIVVGGLHGNEPAGVAAARLVATHLLERVDRLHGDVVLLAGNTRALECSRRYVDVDLNRHWTPVRIGLLESGDETPDKSEDVDQRELHSEFEDAERRSRGEMFVVDLHSTSAPGAPFVTLGDTLRNRNFAMAFPVTIILGIEEQLDGTMLSMLNEEGKVTLGFEAGQHDDPASVANDVAAIWLALVTAGLLESDDVPDLVQHQRRLALAGGGRRFVEVRHRHPVRPGDGFEMRPGYVNFQRIVRGETLASDWRGPIHASESGLMLMPLYQSLGEDGYFLAREIRPFWLAASRVLRRSGVAKVMHWLPGVRRHVDDPNVLFVNTRLARYFPLQVFHLLGYRRMRWTDDWLSVARRPE